MNQTDLLETIRNGENSGVEFKRDDIRPEKLAAEMVALLNLGRWVRPPGSRKRWEGYGPHS